MDGKHFFSPTPRLQKAVVKITTQVMQMTTSENVILYGMGTYWYHLTKVARGVQRKCIFLDLAHGLNPLKPEFNVVIFIHYKSRIAVAILDL